jgi:hypothetical protein
MLGNTDFSAARPEKMGLAAFFISPVNTGAGRPGVMLYRVRPFLLPIFGELVWPGTNSTPAPAAVLLRRFGFSHPENQKTIRRTDNGF